MTTDGRVARHNRRGLKLLTFMGVTALLSGAAVAVSPVADAAQKRDHATVQALIKQGADVNAAQGDGMTALHWAAEFGDTAMATTLLSAGAGVTGVTRINSYTPLHIASKSGSAVIVKKLLAAGANANAITPSGATPLHFAAAAGSADAVNALLDKGAAVNARELESGQTPLMFAATFNRAAAITALIKRGADPLLSTKVINVTESGALDQAAGRRRTEVLTEMGVGGRGAPPPTPGQMQAAIEESRKVITSALSVSAGSFVEEVDTINGGVVGFTGAVGAMGGLTALHHAVRQGNIEAVKALLDGGADINKQTADKNSPLLMAAINGQFDVAMVLIERGANPKPANDFGDTPLYAIVNIAWMPKSRFPQPQASQHQKTDYLVVMEALLKAGADPNARITRQPWYFAYNNCGNGNCGLQNTEGSTPFWRAAYSVDPHAMRLLVKYGADPTIGTQRSAAGGGGRGGGGGGRGGRGGAPGGRAGGTGAGVATGADSVQIAAAQAQAAAAFGGRGGRGGGRGGPPGGFAGGPGSNAPGGDSAAAGGRGAAGPPAPAVPPIHAAAGAGYGDGYAGNSHRHMPDGWLPAMKYLVEELKQDVNMLDGQGYTPMHHAAARGDNEMILYLVSKGADPKIVARNGRTTVDMANGPVSRLKPFPETIVLLEKLGAKNNHRCVGC